MALGPPLPMHRTALGKKKRIMSKAWFKWLFIAMATIMMLPAPPTRSVEAVPLPQRDSEKILLSEYLLRMGLKLDCYFTIETQQLYLNETAFSPKGKSSLSTSTVTIPPS